VLRLRQRPWRKTHHNNEIKMDAMTLWAYQSPYERGRSQKTRGVGGTVDGQGTPQPWRKKVQQRDRTRGKETYDDVPGQGKGSGYDYGFLGVNSVRTGVSKGLSHGDGAQAEGKEIPKGIQNRSKLKQKRLTGTEKGEIKGDPCRAVQQSPRYRGGLFFFRGNGGENKGRERSPRKCQSNWKNPKK